MTFLSGNTGLTLPNQTGDLFLSGFNGKKQYATGLLDELAIWNRALFNQEILNLYNNTGASNTWSCKLTNLSEGKNNISVTAKDEDDIYPSDIKMSTSKNNPVLLSKLELTLDNIPDVDIIFLTIPEDAEKEALKAFINTAHEQKTLVLPIISTNAGADIIGQIESIIENVSENEYDGVVIEKTELNLVANLSAALHNRGKQLIVSVVYTEELELYDIEPYIDRLIFKFEAEDVYTVESAIMNLRTQVAEGKIILEIPAKLQQDNNINELLSIYGVNLLSEIKDQG